MLFATKDHVDGSELAHIAALFDAALLDSASIQRDVTVVAVLSGACLIY